MRMRSVRRVRLDMMRRAWRMSVNRRVLDRSARMHGV